MHQFRLLLCVAVCCNLAQFANSVIQYKPQKIRGPPMPIPSRLTRNPQNLGTYTHQYQYTKSKRPQPQRNTGRPSNVRPIPVHMASYKVPVISRPPKNPAPLIFPSAIWKTPTAVYRPPVENAKPYFVNPSVSHQNQQLHHQQLQLPKLQHQHVQHQHLQHQHIQQPQIQLQQFDYHINKEPMLNIPTIKQIGEKGPIHTIPAPNLSPADKPKILYEEPAKQSYYQYTKQQEISPNSIQNSIQHSISNSIAPAGLIGAHALPLVSSLPLPQIPHYHAQQTQIPVQQTSAQTHQYQVTENAEGADALEQPYNGQQTYFAPDPDTNLIQKFAQYADTNTNANNMKLYPQDMFVSPHQFVTNAANIPLSAQDLYQLLNGVPQQQLVDSYGMPLMQQPQLQQHFVQQAAQNVPAQNYQFIQPQVDNAAYFNQLPDTVSQQIKDNFKPQFQTFNYEEPKKDFAQSRVTADYSIEPEAADSSPKPVQQQNPQEALAQTQYIQQYFQTREDSNVADNELESNNGGSTKESQILSELSAKNEISPTMFYSSLPNREAAEALATLQAAGSINTILKLNQNKNEQNANQRDSMRIYVPDDEETYDDLETSGESNKNNQENNGFKIFETTHLKKDVENRSSESSEYEDYSGEDVSSETSEQETNFGNKLKTKTSTR